MVAGAHKSLENCLCETKRKWRRKPRTQKSTDMQQSLSFHVMADDVRASPSETAQQVCCISVS